MRFSRRSLLQLAALALAGCGVDVGGITVEDYMRAIAKGVRRGMSRVLVLEPQAGPWANQNFWGDQRVQPLPVAANQSVAVLPKNTSFYGPPMVHSVGLVRGDDIKAQNADVYAKVTYGCGGVQNSFLVDWLHGTQIALVCNSVTVEAVSYRVSELSAYNASNASVFLGAMVAKGTIAQGRCPATKTEALVEVANNGSAAFPVPDFAREVTAHLRTGVATLNSNPATPTNVTITCADAGAGVLARYDLQVCAGGRSIPIPGGTTEIRFVNSSGSTITLTTQFFLGF